MYIDATSREAAGPQPSKPPKTRCFAPSILRLKIFLIDIAMQVQNDMYMCWFIAALFIPEEDWK